MNAAVRRAADHVLATGTPRWSTWCADGADPYAAGPGYRDARANPWPTGDAMPGRTLAGGYSDARANPWPAGTGMPGRTLARGYSDARANPWRTRCLPPY